MLGWDIFNPEEFLPEFIADVGIKKGEKVDYAIVENGAPAVLIECKWSGAPLERHDSQLFRYFGTTSAKFAILTNGLVYKFYTDLDEANKMDLTPFLEVDMLNLQENLVAELKRFHKESFDPESMASTASDLKYSKALKDFFARQLETPSDEFTKFFAAQVYEGVKTAAVVERFTGLVQASLNDFITERMNDRLREALGGKNTPQVEAKAAQKAEDPVEETPAEAINKIVTTQEELEAFYMVKTLLHDVIQPERISFKDTQSYFSIIVDGMVTHWIARLALGECAKNIWIMSEDKKPQKFQIESADGIYGLREQLLVAAQVWV
jgi:hypothetical protein